MATRNVETRELLREICRESPPSRFLDYRDFLRHLHGEVERRVGRYPVVHFSADLGLEAGNVAYMVLHGYRRLSESQTLTVCERLGITGTERRFLLRLREYADCKDEGARHTLFQSLVALKEQVAASEHDRLMLRFFASWHHAALFEMIDLPDFHSDPEWIAGRFFKPLTVDEVKRSLALLEALELIRFDPEAGRHVKTQKSLSTSGDVEGLAVVGYHLEMLGLGQAALSQVPAGEREIGALTVAVTERVAERLKEDLQLFRRYVVFLSEQCEGADRLLQLNFQLFPLTRA